MIKIKKIGSEDEIHSYEFESSDNIHNELINFLNAVGFDADEIDGIDTPFSELSGEYIFVKKEDMRIYFFICDNKINMVVDSKKTHSELSNLMKNNFIFPHKSL